MAAILAREQAAATIKPNASSAAENSKSAVTSRLQRAGGCQLETRLSFECQAFMGPRPKVNPSVESARLASEAAVCGILS